MMVLNDKCKLCNYTCYSIHFQQNFNNWTSGNNDIDKFIQDTQLSSHDDLENILELISYDKFCDITYIAEDRYQANWIDGNINYWDESIQYWIRKGQNMIVILKKLNNTKDITLLFVDEV
jgi:hypothetical protein